jgi:hypothetical protein
MGIFSSSNEKLSSKEMKKALFQIKSLSGADREEIMQALRSDLDMGGITKFELSKTIRELEKSNQISKFQRKFGLFCIISLY